MTNKLTVSKSLSKELNISLNESQNILEKFLKLIINNSKIKKVKVNGFGAFHYRTTPQRTGRNPKTLESYIIKPRKKLVFTVSDKIKKILN